MNQICFFFVSVSFLTCTEILLFKQDAEYSLSYNDDRVSRAAVTI